MITIILEENEVVSLIQALESERDEYVKSFGKCTSTIVQQVSRRMINENNALIAKLEEALI